ncbi:MAG: hypothetical protein CL764_06105 [Chloroflexi bacterium]|nr:hypothetical protein [Chloroflexota bacterium]|tara:strand:+ start:6418 stop:7443 length:1026 start_codon:yes stop_codon:yes gene_type:complete
MNIKNFNFSSNNKFLISSFFLGILIIFFVIRLSNVDIGEFWKQITRSDFKILGLALIVYYLGFLPRGFRFLLMTDLHSNNKNLFNNFLKSSVFLLIGWFINSLTLLRAGDLYRIWLFTKEFKLKFINLFAFLLSERLQDLIIITSILLCIFLFAFSETQFPFWIVLTCLAISLILIFLLIVGVATSRLIKYFPLSKNLDSSSFRENFYKPLRSKNLIFQLICGILAWTTEIFRLALVLMALNIELSFSLIILVTILGTILTIVPLPGGLGIVEGGLIGVLIIIGFDSTTALTITIVDRSITWFSILFTGSIAFIFWNITKKTKMNNFFPYSKDNQEFKKIE